MNIKISEHWGRIVVGTGQIDAGVVNSGAKAYAGGGRVAIVGHIYIADTIVRNINVDGAAATKGGSGTLYLRSHFQSHGHIIAKSSFEAVYKTPVAGQHVLCGLTVDNAFVPTNKKLTICSSGNCTKLNQGKFECPLAEVKGCKCASGCLPAQKIHNSKCVSDCPPGTFVDTTTGTCTPCDGTTEYSDTQNSAACKPRGKCAAGQYARNPVSVTQTINCQRCPQATYMPSENTFGRCIPHTECSAGTVVSSAPSATQDATCSPCNGLFNFSASANQQTCQPIGYCNSGEYLAKAASSRNNVVCKACANGYFQTATSQHRLTKCTRAAPSCRLRHYQTAAPTTSSDRQCSPYTQCLPDAEYEKQQATATSNRICSNVTMCEPGTREATGGAATATRDTLCVPCPLGQYQDERGQRKCKPMLTCVAGQHISQAGSAIADRVCAPCGNHTFQPAPNQASCIQRTPCEKGSHIVTQTTPVADQTCAPCDKGTTFQDEVNQPSCKPATTCENPLAAIRPNATLDSDANCCSTYKHQETCVDECPSSPNETFAMQSTMVCNPCTVCEQDQYEAIACNARYDRLCRRVQRCAPGQYVSKNATRTQNKECAACAVGTFSSTPDAQACSTVTTCAAGASTSQRPTNRSDTGCVPCALDKTFQPQSDQDICINTSECSADQTQVAAPTLTSDRVCANPDSMTQQKNDGGATGIGGLGNDTSVVSGSSTAAGDALTTGVGTISGSDAPTPSTKDDDSGQNAGKQARGADAEGGSPAMLAAVIALGAALACVCIAGVVYVSRQRRKDGARTSSDGRGQSLHLSPVLPAPVHETNVDHAIDTDDEQEPNDHIHSKQPGALPGTMGADNALEIGSSTADAASPRYRSMTTDAGPNRVSSADSLYEELDSKAAWSESQLHGLISRTESEKRLRAHGLDDGVFLVRQKNDTTYVLTVYSQKKASGHTI